MTRPDTSPCRSVLDMLSVSYKAVLGMIRPLGLLALPPAVLSGVVEVAARITGGVGWDIAGALLSGLIIGYGCYCVARYLFARLGCIPEKPLPAFWLPDRHLLPSAWIALPYVFSVLMIGLGFLLLVSFGAQNARYLEPLFAWSGIVWKPLLAGLTYGLFLVTCSIFAISYLNAVFTGIFMLYRSRRVPGLMAAFGKGLGDGPFLRTTLLGFSGWLLFTLLSLPVISLNPLVAWLNDLSPSLQAFPWFMAHALIAMTDNWLYIVFGFGAFALACYWYREDLELRKPPAETPVHLSEFRRDQNPGTEAVNR